MEFKKIVNNPKKLISVSIMLSLNFIFPTINIIIYLITFQQMLILNNYLY